MVPSLYTRCTLAVTKEIKISPVTTFGCWNSAAVHEDSRCTTWWQKMYNVHWLVVSTQSQPPQTTTKHVDYSDIIILPIVIYIYIIKQYQTYIGAHQTVFDNTGKLCNTFTAVYLQLWKLTPIKGFGWCRSEQADRTSAWATAVMDTAQATL